MPGGSKQKSDKPFTEGEKVLCYHGPLLYEAKVNKIQTKDKQLQFLVHYSGWSKSWDEWVPETRILKINNANLQKQKELQQQNPLVERQRKVATKRKAEKRKEIEPPTRRRRVRHDVSEGSTRDSSPLSRPEVKIEFSEDMKKWLVDDWDLVTRQKQLVRIPKAINMQGILKQYQDHVKTTDPDKNLSGQLNEICEGLQEYFDVMLGTQLLYKFERPQYSDMLQMFPDKTPSEIYGIEHFLRLFVRLGTMLGYTAVDDENLAMLQTHIQELVGFLSDNINNFPMEYDPAPAEYLRRLA